jgi:hypothetical protein
LDDVAAYFARETERRLAAWHAEQEALIRAALRDYVPGWMLSRPRLLLLWLRLRGLKVLTVSAVPTPLGEYRCEVRVERRR